MSIYIIAGKCEQFKDTNSRLVLNLEMYTVHPPNTGEAH